MFTIFSLILSVLFLVYFILMQIFSPQTFFATIFGFSIIWFLLAVFFAILPILHKKGILKKISKKLKIVFASVIFVFFVIFLVNFIQILNPRFENKNSSPDFVILLGGGVTKEGKLTQMVMSRVEKTAEYLKQNPQSVCVVTGGKLPFMPCSEAEILKPTLINLGIEENRVFEEKNARDTIENFIFSVNLLSEKLKISKNQILKSKVTVITNDFHIARAERLACRMGFENLSSVKAQTPLIFRPNCYAREILCYIKLNLRILFTQKPNKSSILQ